MTPDPTNTSTVEGDRRSPVRPERLLLTPREAARMLSVSPRTLWGSDVPKIRIGKTGVRYALADLEAWIERQRVAS